MRLDALDKPLLNLNCFNFIKQLLKLSFFFKQRERQFLDVFETIQNPFCFWKMVARDLGEAWDQEPVT